MKKISTHTFKHTLKDIHKNTESRKFCFIIGAGASSKSGIPTGGELAEKWFLEIKERSDKAELEAWISDNKINKEALLRMELYTENDFKQIKRRDTNF
ncbi:MAG: hypothetical protein KBT69_08545 [Oceanihabitans sp.]|nr:hypothetical protein [Oceanihabitans sp.]